MRFAPAALLFVSLAAAPALCQNTQTSTASTTLPATAGDPSVDYAALRADVANANKNLTDQVNTARAILKKNQDLLKEAQKINAANLKLADEKKKLEAESADLEKQRETLKSAQKPAETAANTTTVASTK